MVMGIIWGKHVQPKSVRPCLRSHSKYGNFLKTPAAGGLGQCAFRFFLYSLPRSLASGAKVMGCDPRGNQGRVWFSNNFSFVSFAGIT